MPLVSTSLFLLSVIYCTLFLSVNFVNGNPVSTLKTAPKDIKLFTDKEIGNVLEPSGSGGGSGDKITPKNLCSPHLVAANNVVVALTGVDCADTSQDNIHILTRYIEISKMDEWLKTATEDNIKTSWTTQYAAKKVWKKKEEKSNFFLAAAKGENIYILLVNNSDQNPPATGGELPWNIKLFVGTVADKKPTEGKISWSNDQSSEYKINELKEKFKEKHLTSFPTDSSVLLTEDGSIFFVLQFNKAKADKQKTVVMVIIEVDKPITTVRYAEIDNADKCLFNLFTWKNKIMMLKYFKDNKSMQLSENKNDDKWEITNDSISRVLHHVSSENHFTTTLIYNGNALLFTQQRKSVTCTAESKKLCIDLWMSDGTRSYNVGTIVTNDKEVVIDSLLYTSDKLFSLHHEKEGETKSVIFTNLEQKLKTINDILDKWKASDKKIQELCTLATTAEEAPCSTKGVVGFLSDNEINGEWQDEYFYANATITKNGAHLKNGLKCDGAGQGAVWVVSKSSEDQPYNFTADGFTFLATVTIDGSVEGKDNSLLGIVFVGIENIFGLWCTKGNNFGVSDGGEKTNIKDTKTPCKAAMTYHVAIIWDKSKLSVYANNEKLTNDQLETTNINSLQNIRHFYFGAAIEDEATPTDVESHMTVKNVLLYNRPFDGEEIKKIINYGKTIEASNKAKENTATEGAGGSNGDNSGEERLDLPTNIYEKESVSSPLDSRESDAGISVGVLLFVIEALCCVVGGLYY